MASTIYTHALLLPLLLPALLLPLPTAACPPTRSVQAAVLCCGRCLLLPRPSLPPPLTCRLA